MTKGTFFWERKPDRYKQKKLRVLEKLQIKTEKLKGSGGETMEWKGKEKNPNLGLYPTKPKWPQKFNARLFKFLGYCNL